MKPGRKRKAVAGLESWAVILWGRFYRDESLQEAGETSSSLFWEFTGMERAFRAMGEREAEEMADFLSDVAHVRYREGFGV